MRKSTARQDLKNRLIVRRRTPSRTFFDGLTSDNQKLLRDVAVVVSQGGVCLQPTAVRIVEELGLGVVPSTVVNWLKREAAQNADPEKPDR